MPVEHAGNAKIKFKCVPLLVHDRLIDLSTGKTYQLQLPSAVHFRFVDLFTGKACLLQLPSDGT